MNATDEIVVQAACACCREYVYIALGPPLDIYDDAGAPVQVDDLARLPSGERVILCMYCAWVAKMLVSRGEEFETSTFREAYRRKFAEMMALSDPFFGSGPEPLPKNTEQEWTAEDNRALEEFENSMFVRHYQEVRRERQQAEEKRERRALRRQMGLRLVSAPTPSRKDDSDIPF